MIMKVRKCSLRNMMSDGLVDDRIAKEVLKGLKDVASGRGDTNGDLKAQKVDKLFKNNFNNYFQNLFAPF